MADTVAAAFVAAVVLVGLPGPRPTERGPVCNERERGRHGEREGKLKRVCV